MAYDPKLGYDPDLDYTAAYAAETDPINRGRLAEARGKKKAAMTAAGTYDPTWDASWNKVYGANPISGMDSNGSYGAYGSTPIGQMGLGKSVDIPAMSAYSDNAYSYNTNTTNPYADAQRQAEEQLRQSTQLQIGQANAMYDNEAKNAYIQREQQMKNLPTQLAAQGITGGMAETSAVRVGTNYNNRVATSEAARANAVANINIASAQQMQQMALDYADRIIAQQNADRAFNYQQSRDAVSDSQWNTTYNRGVYESDRNYGYQQSRDKVADTQYQQQFDRGVLESDRGYAYQQGRDTVADQRYNAEWNYGVGRDAVSDARYADETQYSRGRDTIGDQQYQQQFNYNAYRDQVSDAQNASNTAYNQQQNNSNTAYNRAIDAANASGDYSGMAQYGWSANQIKQANALYMATDGTMKLSDYAGNIVSNYLKDSNYNIETALNNAVKGGFITEREKEAALIAAGKSTTNTSSSAASAYNWTDNPNNLGYGPITQDRLRELIDSGDVVGKYENGRIIYRRVK